MATSPCPHFPDCAACALSGQAYGDQLRAKHRRLADSLAAYPTLAPLAVPDVIGSQRLFGYRNVAKLVARRTGRGLLLGVYRPGSHQVVDVGSCVVHQPPIPAVLAAVRNELERAAVPTYDERDGSGWLRYVVVRSSGWKHTAQLIPVVRDRAWAGERELLKRLRAVRGVSSIVLNVNPTPGNVILSDTFVPVTHETALLERIGGLRLKSSAGSFLQANIANARRAYERVLLWANPQPEEVAVDLYAGVGAISFYLAGSARRVVGVEESAIAVGDAKQNIRLNGYHNVHFVAAPAAVGLASAASDFGRIDIVTLNPPRKGADEATRATILACAPSRIVYVSCEPSTLARDLDWLAARGYRVTALQPYDFLPQTEHVETVALLEK